MLDAGPELWRKPHRESFDEQRKKVLGMTEKWKPYDWTHKIRQHEQTQDSSSSSDDDEETSKETV